YSIGRPYILFCLLPMVRRHGPPKPHDARTDGAAAVSTKWWRKSINRGILKLYSVRAGKVAGGTSEGEKLSVKVCNIAGSGTFMQVINVLGRNRHCAG